MHWHKLKDCLRQADKFQLSILVAPFHDCVDVRVPFSPFFFLRARNIFRRRITVTNFTVSILILQIQRPRPARIKANQKNYVTPESHHAFPIDNLKNSTKPPLITLFNKLSHFLAAPNICGLAGLFYTGRFSFKWLPHA